MHAPGKAHVLSAVITDPQDNRQTADRERCAATIGLAKVAATENAATRDHGVRATLQIVPPNFNRAAYHTNYTQKATRHRVHRHGGSLQLQFTVQPRLLVGRSLENLLGNRPMQRH